MNGAKPSPMPSASQPAWAICGPVVEDREQQRARERIEPDRVRSAAVLADDARGGPGRWRRSQAFAGIATSARINAASDADHGDEVRAEPDEHVDDAAQDLVVRHRALNRSGRPSSDGSGSTPSARLHRRADVRHARAILIQRPRGEEDSRHERRGRRCSDPRSRGSGSRRSRARRGFRACTATTRGIPVSNPMTRSAESATWDPLVEVLANDRRTHDRGSVVAQSEEARADVLEERAPLAGRDDPAGLRREVDVDLSEPHASRRASSTSRCPQTETRRRATSRACARCDRPCRPGIPAPRGSGSGSPRTGTARSRGRRRRGRGRRASPLPSGCVR